MRVEIPSSITKGNVLERKGKRGISKVNRRVAWRCDPSCGLLHPYLQWLCETWCSAMVTGAGSGPNQTVCAQGCQSLVWKDVSLKNIGTKFQIFYDAHT